MFTKINKDNNSMIRLTRGDSAEFSTKPYDNNSSPVDLSENDIVVFAVGVPTVTL